MRSNVLATRIANEIANLIRMGQIEPGSHLSTQKLADQFDVSRSPVREALQILAEQGLVELHSNRGFFVRTGSGPHVTPSGDTPLMEASPEYQRLADDWLRDQIPAEVTE